MLLLGPQCFTTRIESIANVVQQLNSDTLVGRTNGRLQNEKEQQTAIPEQGIDASGSNRHGCEPILLHKSLKKITEENFRVPTPSACCLPSIIITCTHTPIKKKKL